MNYWRSTLLPDLQLYEHLFVGKVQYSPTFNFSTLKDSNFILGDAEGLDWGSFILIKWTPLPSDPTDQTFCSTKPHFPNISNNFPIPLSENITPNPSHPDFHTCGQLQPDFLVHADGSPAPQCVYNSLCQLCLYTSQNLAAGFHVLTYFPHPWWRFQFIINRITHLLLFTLHLPLYASVFFFFPFSKGFKGRWRWEEAHT